MAKEAKPNMQIEGYCLAVHKNTCKRTLQYAEVEKQIAEVEKQIAEKFNFVIIFLSFFLTFFFLSSGNHTPGSRSYSDRLDTLADSVCTHQLVSQSSSYFPSLSLLLSFS